MANKATAIDLGSHGIRVLQAKAGKHGIQITGFAATGADDGLASIAGAVPLKDSIVGLAGRAMMMRYTQVPPGPDSQLESLMELEIEDMSSQSGGQLSADYNLLQIQGGDEEPDDDTVLLALARNEALDEQSSAVQEAGGTVAGHVPACVAIYNAWLRCGQSDEDEVVCLVNLGHETIDLAIVRGVDLLFVRNLTGGGRVLDDAIAGAFSVSGRKAEQLKKELLDLDPQSRNNFESGQAEKVTMAAGGAASAFVSAIQSSLAFCRSQTKIADLDLDRVMLSGGSARIKGVRGMLREALRCPVDLFDPFEACDTSTLSPQAAEELETLKSESVVALGLAIGRVDEGAYDLTILPESVKRRRRFLQQTIWNIAAALVLVGVLFVVMQERKESVETADGVLRRVRTRVSRIRDTHDRTVEVLEENARLSEQNDYLAKQAVPLHGMLHASRLLQMHLPRELYLTELQVLSARSGRTGADVARIKMVGTGKEISGRSRGDVYDEFLRKCRDQKLDGHTVRITPELSQGEEFEFTWTLDFELEKPSGDADGEGDD